MIKKFIVCSVAIIAMVSYVSAKNKLSLIADSLMQKECFKDSCSYEVLLPSFSDPISYSVYLESMAAPGDTLSPCDYYISWQMPTPSGMSSGFSAYFEGNHFRFRDKRLQEYHYADDPVPFAPAGNTSKGVQLQAQFTELLPQFLGEKFKEMINDSTFVFSVTENHEIIKIEGVRRISGYDCAEYTYLLERQTLNPVKFEFENNPGQLGEQSITVRFQSSVLSDSDCSLNLENLISRQNEAFEKYRESAFSLENLPGRPLPEISSPTIGGERFFRAAGQKTASPSIMVFLDTSVGSTPKVVEAVRNAVAYLPVATDVVWAFIDKRADDVAEIIGKPLPSETVLISASGAARDCGVGAVTPVVLFVGKDGIVKDFVRGFNQELESIVIQKSGIAAGL